ncbi:MAG: (Na+)-NQR maturation NqrM [Methylococcaceae bacterium]
MTLFLITFLIMIIIVSTMAVGVMFGRPSIKGSCGGLNKGNCICVKKCEKRRALEAQGKV